MRPRADLLPALATLFADRAADARHFALPGGAALFETGDRTEQLYLLKSGRLGAIADARLLGVVRPGEPVGETALLADIPHGATVVALRDSEVLAMDRTAFLAAAAERPAVLLELSRLLISRAATVDRTTRAAEPSVFALIGWTAPARALAEQAARALRSEGAAVAVLGPEHGDAATGWLSELEASQDYVLYVADPADAAWALACARQADRIFLVVDGDRSPHGPPPSCVAQAMRAHKPVDLLLLAVDRARGAERWLDAVEDARPLHLRRGASSDVARFARVLSGRAVALVLSGGGARGYAHVGAIRALRAAGVPLDAVGGTSMGAVVGAALAMGWDDAEIEARIRRAFVDSSPLDDIAFPMLAMTRGGKVRARLEEHFGGQSLADLPLPFFCCSSDLTAGALRVHERGDLAWALGASIALPGILPPVLDGETVLVDGGVLRNLPTDVMRARHAGPLVAVDVSSDHGVSACDIAPPASLPRWIASGEWRRGPPIVSVLLRSATVTAGRELAAARALADVFIAPELDGVEIRDWNAFDRGTAAGRTATELALAVLDGPVTRSRMRA